MGEKKGLLDEILERSGYLYISDLRKNSAVRKVQRAVEGVGTERYDVEEWQEAYAYIIGKKTSEIDELEIREQFKNELASTHREPNSLIE